MTTSHLISRDYSALSDEIYDILRILKALRAIIVGLTTAENQSAVDKR